MQYNSQYAGTSGTNAIKEIFGDKVFTYPKSPYMVKDTLEIASKPGDIVLDYHLGSGTTAAVAHKMGRQYIGVEQMDYIEDIAVERLKKVIAGEEGGISKKVNWQGGGDFIYFELAKFNEDAKSEIQNCETYEELVDFFEYFSNKYFLKYNLNIDNFHELIQEGNFKKLSLEQQKEMFMTMLDLNQMYVPASEMADTRYNISEEDQALTSEFYGEDE